MDEKRLQGAVDADGNRAAVRWVHGELCGTHRVDGSVLHACAQSVELWGHRAAGAPSPVRTAGTRPLNPFRLTPVCTSTSARAVRRSSSPRRATAACFV